MALEARGSREALDVMIYKVLLMREKAKLTRDPAERQALEDETAQLEQQAVEIQVRARGAAGANR